MAGQLLPWIDSGDAEGNRNSMQNFLGDGVTTSWDFNFAGGYINVAHVKAYIYRSTSGLTEAIDPVVLTGPNTIQVIPAVPVGDYLVVYRDTPKDQPLVDYTTGAVLNEANLDMSNQQAVFATAEMADRFDAINASSADAIERSFQALTIANAADDKADSAITASTNAVNTANAANTTAAEALAIAEDAVAASTGFQTNLEFYTGDDVTSRGADWQTGSVASPGNQRWFAGTDTASDFTIDRYNDAGVLQGSAIKVDRQTGNVTAEAGAVVGTTLAVGTSLSVGTNLSVGGQLDMTSGKVVNLAAGSDPADAVTKSQLDAVASAAMQKAANLSDVVDVSTARSNLGVSDVLIARGTTAGSQTLITFTGLANTYSKLMFSFAGLRPGTAGTKVLTLQLSTDNGATWKNDASYAYTLMQSVFANPSPVVDSATGTALIMMGGIDMFGVPDRSASGEITLFDLGRAGGGTKRIMWDFAAVLSDANLRQVRGAGGYFGDALSTQGFNAFSIGFSDSSAFENGMRWSLRGVL